MSGANGQSCFWFSNGCSIGCDECDGNTRGPVPKFIYIGNDTVSALWIDTAREGYRNTHHSFVTLHNLRICFPFRNNVTGLCHGIRYKIIMYHVPRDESAG